MKKECPRCGQGVLLLATIRALGEKVVVCDDCEALWASEDKPALANFHDMVTFLKSKGIEGAWNALAIEEGEKTG